VSRPAPAALRVAVWGAGPPVLLLHGSTRDDGATAWRAQRPLAARYRLIVPDRRGYGASPGPSWTSWEDHLADAIGLLGGPAHFVGHSYGAVIGLLVATRRPDLLRSLTLIEPPAFGLAADQPDVAALRERLIPVFAPDSGLTPEQFSAAFARALGHELQEATEVSPARREQTRNIMREPGPWTAPIDLATIAAARLPALVVSGAWHPGFEAVCDAIAAAVSAERLVLPGAGHSPHRLDEGRPLNAALAALWAAN
jgi:pimeloyl-ACP methyl ester carboxylesterase